MEVDVNTTEQTDSNLSKKESLRNDMLDYLCSNTEAHFKSQQRGEPELNYSEKRLIAEQVLDNSYGIFLSRFGDFLLDKHLSYFSDCSDSDRYEVDFYLKRIRAIHNKSISKVKVRNRRFEALKKLVCEGSYFSEYEMKKRNPLLYEQLVGKFLTQEEENERTGVDTTNITFVNLLLEKYDRDQMKKLREKQKKEENNQRESKEHQSDLENEEEMNVDFNNDENGRTNVNSTTKEGDLDEFEEKPIVKTLWGEEMTEKSRLGYLPSSSKVPLSPKNTSDSSVTSNFNIVDNDMENEEEVEEEEEIEEEEEVSDDEKNLLMEEFRSSMFNSFLEGKDSDFDYNDVDKNSDYDDIDMRDLDEQEKYFDSETPEDFRSNSGSNSNQGFTSNSNHVSSITNVDGASNTNIVETDQNTEDSVIDKYVEKLKDIENTEKITTKMENLHH